MPLAFETIGRQRDAVGWRVGMQAREIQLRSSQPEFSSRLAHDRGVIPPLAGARHRVQSPLLFLRCERQASEGGERVARAHLEQIVRRISAEDTQACLKIHGAPQVLRVVLG